MGQRHPSLKSDLESAPLTADDLGNVARVRWFASRGTLQDARRAAAKLGWTEKPVRRGDPIVSDLRAVRREDAHPSSLSAAVGLDAQPLHTDGAHLRRPPDVIVIASTGPTRTATRILDVARSTRVLKDALMNGVFSVTSGPDRFYTTAATAEGLRYDPGCMTACDQRSRIVAEYFSTEFESAHRHEWTVPDGQLLILNNRQTLHAREAVHADDMNRTLQRVAFWIPQVP